MKVGKYVNWIGAGEVPFHRFIYLNFLHKTRGGAEATELGPTVNDSGRKVLIGPGRANHYVPANNRDY